MYKNKIKIINKKKLQFSKESGVLLWKDSKGVNIFTKDFVL